MKPGYKQTEVGVIPEDWEVKLFSELFAFRNGVNADKAAYGQGIRFINVLEPITYSHIHGPEITGKVTLPESVVASYSVRRGDVLFNRTSETQEEVALAATYLGSEPVVFGGFVIRGRPLAENFDPTYSGYALRAPCIRSQIIPMGQGAVRANVGQQNLGRVLAPVPPLPEQRAIASALSDVDGLLGALDRLIAKKRDLKQAAMQQLLTGQTRLPGFTPENVSFKQTEVGKIPEDWDVTEIGDGIDLLTGYPFPSSEYATTGVRLLRGSNVKRGQTDWDEDITQYWEAITPDIRRYELKDGDLVIAMDGSLVGRSYARLAPDDLPALLLQRVARIRTKTIDVAYLCAFVGSDRFVKYSDSVKTVTAIPHISPGDIRKFRIPVPPTLSEQAAIAGVLSDMDAELAALEERREKTRALKQGMMQELLTGRTRLI
ncbi:MAG: restriction endonuclease subunit S [Verrucomicrobiota bacterium]